MIDTIAPARQEFLQNLVTDPNIPPYNNSNDELTPYGDAFIHYHGTGYDSKEFEHIQYWDHWVRAHSRQALADAWGNRHCSSSDPYVYSQSKLQYKPGAPADYAALNLRRLIGDLSDHGANCTCCGGHVWSCGCCGVCFDERHLTPITTLYKPHKTTWEYSPVCRICFHALQNPAFLGNEYDMRQHPFGYYGRLEYDAEWSE